MTSSLLITAWTPGFWEIFLLFLAVLILFGPKSIPQLARSFGRGMREFKDASSKLTESLDDEDDEKPKRKPGTKHQDEEPPRAQLTSQQSPPNTVATSAQGSGVSENR